MLKLWKLSMTTKSRQIARRDGAAVVEQEVAGGVVAGGLDGHDRVCAHGDGALDDIVDVALFQQIVGVLVVRAEHAALGVLAVQQPHQCLQIPGGSALADHDELAARSFSMASSMV
jgi:hypothetical protein